MVRRRVMAAFLATLALGGFWSGGHRSWAQNGNVVFQTGVCTGSSNAIDVCIDTIAGTLWQADQFSGELCEYALSPFPPDIAPLSTIPHPFGPGSPFPPSPRITGLAFDPVTNSLLVVDVATFQVQEVEKLTGAALGAPITVTPPDPNASLLGMTYDSISNSVWFVDVNNDKLLKFARTTGAHLGTINLPTNFPGENLYGQGLAFVPQGTLGALDVTYGHTLDFGPVRTIRVDILSGVPTGFEVDLTQVGATVRGIATPAGTVLYACSNTTLYKIDATQPTLPPVTALTCFSELDGSVQLSWQNHGPFGGAYSVITVERPGLNEILAGSAESFVDVDPPQGQTVTYTVTAFNVSLFSETTCTVHVGRGGIIDYTPFPGTKVYDLAANLSSNTLYATDTQGNKIYAFDTLTMQVTNIIDTSGTVPNPTGIAYNSVLDRLVVAALNSSTLRVLDPVTGVEQVQFPTPFPTNAIGALTYDVIQDHYLYLNLTQDLLVRVEATPPPLGGPGQLISSCSPSVITGLEFNQGLTALATGQFIVTVRSLANGQNAGAQQFNPGTPNCFPSTPSLVVSLDDMGPSEEEPDGQIGIESVGNVLFVAGGATNTIFRILLAATGGTFIRGDADGSGALPNLADAFFVANYLFIAGATPLCPDAADANDDGFIDISDPLYLIIYEFLLGPQPPPPFPLPGSDPTFLDPLDC